MKLDGIHHITAITADAQRNVDFYVEVMGLRMVKKTVNFDAPDVYHLYFADEEGTPGSVLTFFEFKGVERGQAGPGMIHRILWRVPSEAALDHWEARLGNQGVEVARSEMSLEFTDPEGLGLGLLVEETQQRPLRAAHPDIPEEFALAGFAGVRAYGNPDESAGLLTSTLGFERDGPRFGTRGQERSGFFEVEPKSGRAVQGAGTVHHIAWACEMDVQAAWREKIAEAGAHVTEIIDRQYFFSIYFREPSGVLFEIATKGPGFAVDEPLDRLGEELKLPQRYEQLRADLERSLTPLRNPRAARAGRK